MVTSDLEGGRMRYAGKVVATVQEKHVGRPFYEVWADFLGWGFGIVGKKDVGKQVIMNNRVPYLESNEQRDRRVSRVRGLG